MICLVTGCVSLRRERQYQILWSPAEYSIQTQTCIILACCTLPNYIRIKEGDTADALLNTESLLDKANDIQPAVVYPKSSMSSKKIDKFRDKLAKKMWEQYQGYITTNRV
jgi:hypothetical protein